MSANMDLSGELKLFKEMFQDINNLDLKLFTLSMLRSYNSKENSAQLCRENKQVEIQISDAQASTALQKCLAMIKTNDKCTEAVTIFREQKLKLKKSQINHCREEKLYIPQKEIEILENDFRIMESTKENRLKTFLFSNMATAVWDHLVKTPIDDDELKVALCSFEIRRKKLFDFQDTIIRLSMKINIKRMRGNSQAIQNLENEIESINKLKVSLFTSFSYRSCLRTIRRLTNGRYTHAVEIYMVMAVKAVKKRVELLRNELSELACITDMVVNKETLVNSYNQSIVEGESVISLYESMLRDNIYLKTARNLIKETIFHAVDRLTKEEVEMLDKVAYDKKLHKEECPVCLNDRKEDGEEIVSMKCSVFHNLCITCAIRAFTVDSRCPVCRAYV